MSNRDSSAPSFEDGNRPALLAVGISGFALILVLAFLAFTERETGATLARIAALEAKLEAKEGELAALRPWLVSVYTILQERGISTPPPPKIEHDQEETSLRPSGDGERGER